MSLEFVFVSFANPAQASEEHGEIVANNIMGTFWFHRPSHRDDVLSSTGTQQTSEHLSTEQEQTKQTGVVQYNRLISYDCIRK